MRTSNLLGQGTLFLAAFSVGLIGMANSADAIGINHRWSFTSDATDSIGSADWTLEGTAAVAAGELVLDGTGTLAGADRSRAIQDGSTIGISSYASITLEFWGTPDSLANTGFVTAAGFGDDPLDTVPADSYILQTHRGTDVSRTAISISTDGDPWTEEDGAEGTELNDDAEHQYVSVLTNSKIELWIDGVLEGSGPVGLANGGNAADNMISGLSDAQAWLGFAYAIDPLWVGTINDVRLYEGTPAPGAVAASFGRGADGAPMDVVPEPTTLALLGCCGVAAFARRRRVL